MKKTVMALGKAYEKPMEMKAPSTTAQPQPPSGGGTAGGPEEGGGITGPDSTFGYHWREGRRRGEQERRGGRVESERERCTGGGEEEVEER